jgi:hypothetical protein
MKGIVTLTLGLVLILSHPQLGKGQELMTFKPEKPVICHYLKENRPDHVKGSHRLGQVNQRAGRVKTAVFEVEYVNFPEDNLAKSAFQHAIEIWETALTSSVPIRIRAEWKTLESGVLGQALWGRAYANFGEEQHSNTFYPVALAEKIARRNLNEVTEPDIVASLSSSASWYYGTDGNTPSGKMDLVTIVLHEVAHGLGFTDSYDLEGTQGSVGLTNGDTEVPFIFDLFVQDQSGKNLVYDFQSPSEELGTALESASLFFSSPLSLKALNGARPELFAPSTFNSGSSISHLDEASFNTNGDANRLMTPHIAFAESIHEPGSVLLAMISDMGWIYTNIHHVRLKDTERKNGEPYVVTALVESDNGYDANSVQLHYSTDGISFTVVAMTPTATPGQFQASLPGTTQDLAYAYFISVVDSENRTFTNPGKIEKPGKEPEQGTFFFNIGADLASPVISHQPVEYIFQGETELLLMAEVTDNMGVKEVLVEYVINGGAVQTSVMRETAEDIFSDTLLLPSLSIGEKIEYRLIARDVAAIENISHLPAAGYFVVAVTGVMPVQQAYVNDFNDGSSLDFFGNTFHIITPEGFEDPAIHSAHPYSNGTGPNNESNYIYQLQIPIQIGNINPVIQFDEIVLIEPGEEGSTFGESNFYDYAVVEGSTDGGASWKAFTEGYDSRDRSEWLVHYNSMISNDNSTAQGNPALFRQRRINMLENSNFSEGDEVLIRFRLFADQLAHGWGWAIDNLSIQGPVTGLEERASTFVKIYPVPVEKDLFIEIDDYANANSAEIQILNMEGRIVYRERLSGTNGRLEKIVDVEFLSDGLYVLKVLSAKYNSIRRFIKTSR